MKHCFYISRHPKGFYYYGKGQTEAVLNQTYHGSGIKLKSSFTLPEYSFDTWTSEVLQEFEIEQDAYDKEKEVVTWTSIADPFCLNAVPGGRTRGNYRSWKKWYDTIMGVVKRPRKKAKKNK